MTLADELVKMAGVLFAFFSAVLAGIFGYGNLHGRVQALERDREGVEKRLAKIEETQQETLQQVSRIAGFLEMRGKDGH